MCSFVEWLVRQPQKLRWAPRSALGATDFNSIRVFFFSQEACQKPNNSKIQPHYKKLYASSSLRVLMTERPVTSWLSKMMKTAQDFCAGCSDRAQPHSFLEMKRLMFKKCKHRETNRLFYTVIKNTQYVFNIMSSILNLCICLTFWCPTSFSFI